jgi:hypothetical protein
MFAVVLAVSGLMLGMTGISQAVGPDPQGTIYVANESPSAVLVFAPGSNGDAIPERTITGPDTGLSGPADIKVDSAGDIFVSNFDNGTVTEYAPGASGDATPIWTLGGSNTGLSENDDMSLEPDGTLVVSTFTGVLAIFPPGSCGNVAPSEAISGSNTGLGLIDGVWADAAGTIFAANTESSEISIFAAGANGNVPPENTITGSNTGLGSPNDVVVGFGGNVFVSSGVGFGGAINAVTVYAPGASGNATPTQDITGSSTDFGNPDDLAVDTSGNIFVTDSEATVGPALLEFASGATGNVAPIAAITGPDTGITIPEGTFIAGPPRTSSATMTTAVSAPSIKLGGSVSDVATLTGGTTPTGSLVFKLFGPSDPTCSAAPAYVSPAQTVSGDGVYDSPTFMPTATGTYSWVAEYSGDSNNAPVSTTCGDPKEQVTVTKPETGPQLDGIASAQHYNSATAKLSTKAAGDLIVAFVGADSPYHEGQVSTVSGGGLTWKLVARENKALGGAEVWVARASGILTNDPITVKASRLLPGSPGGHGYDETITVAAFKNAPGLGAVGKFNSKKGAATGTITTTKANSWVWAIGDDWLASIPRTVPAGQTLWHQAFDSVGDTYWVQSTEGLTKTAGTAVTINDPAPTKDPFDLILVEIL